MRKKRVAMTKQLKREVFTACIVRVSRGILPFGAFKAVAADFNIFHTTVSKVWKSTMAQIPGYQPNTPIDPPFIVANLPSNVFDTNFHNAGRTPLFDHDDVMQEIKNIDPSARRSIRSLAGALGIPRATVGKMKKDNKLKVHTMALKPKLNDDHFLNRLHHCIAKIDRNTINAATGLKYKTMYNEVHVDEKWFFLVKDGGRYYLAADEQPPDPIRVQHKGHITKVMFLCALARPKYNNTTRQWFDGLIGIYPVGELSMYQRRSATHQRGDIMWQNLNMDRDEYQRMIVDLVLPDIKRKMPLNNNIILQQDGASAHLPPDDPVFKAKVAELYGGNEDAVKLYTQPAQSPDLNINDLGFFHSLQSIYYQKSPKNSIELIEIVEEAFKTYPYTKLNRIWVTLQSCMNEIIDSRGDNQYKIPHMNKEGLERLDQLPISIPPVTQDANQYHLAILVD